ncbi:GNAT family N-acetyltransferase [Paenibacillus sp. WLX1005]|uniref:GNAT family N-acetyltransferase n=1 Tax=Paenibacillus sp. WLX1005 TaxID=3243766 RepID=UPI003984442A
MITIQQVTSRDAGLRQLISELDDDLFQRYPAEQVHRLDLDHPDMEQVTFVVAYLDAAPVGCGAIRRLDDQYTELKRFYVQSSHRRKGIAGQLLTALEQRAGEQGHSGIRLETGAAQPEALAFYERNGYIAIERFGEYVYDASSLCYEKSI